MKRVLKYVGMTFVLLLCFCMMQRPVKAQAQTKFLVTWDKTTKAWYHSMDNGKSWSALDLNAFSDGDVLVINGDDCSEGMLRIEVNARISELAVIGKATASVKSRGVGLGYAVTGGSTLIIDSDADEVNANYGSTIQVLGDVGRVNMVYGSNNEKIGVGVSGKVKQTNVHIGNVWNNTTIYDVAAGKLELNEDNILTTSSQYYSLTPAPVVTPAPETTPAAETPSQAPARELDKVPKTGESPMIPVSLFALSAIFAIAGVGVSIRKEKRR